MDSLKIKALSTTTTRSIKQTEFLLSLCDNDFEKLLSLEQKIKENFISYSPGNKEAVEKILKMAPQKYPWRNIIKEYMLNLFKLNKSKELEPIQQTYPYLALTYGNKSNQMTDEMSHQL